MASKIWSATTSNDWSVAGNWTPAGVPATGDDVYLDGTVSSQPIGLGLAQSAVTLASLTIADTYSGTIGTAAAYLAVSATVVSIGVVSQGRTRGAGSGRIKLDTGTNAAAVTVFSTAQNTADAGLDPVRLIGANAGNTLAVIAGRVGIATTSATETASYASISLSTTDAFVTAGRGTTITTATNNGGTLTINSAATTLNATSGTTSTYGAGVIATINANGGNLGLFHRPAGTGITTLNFNGADINFKGNPSAITIGTTNIKKGGSVHVFSPSQVTWGTVTFDPTNTLGLSMQLD